MPTQAEKGESFAALHRGEPFVIPNPWDAGSARLLAQLGFRALATTSSGFAFTLGRRDGDATLAEVVAHVELVDGAAQLPVSVDLENGYGAEPEAAAHAIAAVAGAGAVGGSIEDWDPAGHLYEPAHAAERVAAAAEAARALPFAFMLTGRAENHIRGKPDLDDTIARLQAYEAAGADVLYAPGLATADEIRAVCDSGGQTGQRPCDAKPHFRRAGGGGRPADQRRRRAGVGGGECARRGGHRDPRSRRLLAARRFAQPRL